MAPKDTMRFGAKFFLRSTGSRHLGRWKLVPIITTSAHQRHLPIFLKWWTVTLSKLSDNCQLKLIYFKRIIKKVMKKKRKERLAWHIKLGRIYQPTPRWENWKETPLTFRFYLLLINWRFGWIVLSVWLKITQFYPKYHHFISHLLTHVTHNIRHRHVQYHF